MRLASAMAATFTGFLCGIRDSQSLPGFRRRRALIRARNRSRRRHRFPAFEIRPSRSLPPVECGFGARPGRMIARRAEDADPGRGRRERAGGQGADAGNDRAAACKRILGLGRRDPLRHVGDAGARVAEPRGEELQRGSGRLGRLPSCGQQPDDVVALGHHGAELGQMRAERVHGPGLLADQELAGLVVHQRRLPLGRLHRGRAGGTPAA